LDYGPWVPFKIFPAPDGVELQVPIVALVNTRSVSAAEWSAMFISSLPNGYVVGGTTWGGFGSPWDSRLNNGGSFSGPLFSVSTALNETKYLDGVNYEGRGFPPDIFVPFDYDALQAGTDTRLEAAIQCVLEHQ
jgi:C-terminal processing protease CtpA/Prc